MTSGKDSGRFSKESPGGSLTELCWATLKHFFSGFLWTHSLEILTFAAREFKPLAQHCVCFDLICSKVFFSYKRTASKVVSSRISNSFRQFLVDTSKKREKKMRLFAAGCHASFGNRIGQNKTKLETVTFAWFYFILVKGKNERWRSIWSVWNVTFF